MLLAQTIKDNNNFHISSWFSDMNTLWICHALNYIFILFTEFETIHSKVHSLIFNQSSHSSIRHVIKY